LLRRGATPVLQGEDPFALPKPQLDELLKIAEITGKKIYYITNEKLYVLVDDLKTVANCETAGQKTIADITEIDNIGSLERKLPRIISAGDRESLKELAGQAEIFHLFAKGDVLFWGRKIFGKGLQTEDRFQFRGYAQVDLDQIPVALGVIQRLAVRRERGGKGTIFKFLLARVDIMSFKFKGGSDLSACPLELAGYYENQDQDKPVIVFYAQTKGDILEMLEQLSQEPEWREIESGRQFKHRREGSSAFTNSAGIEFRTLCYNESNGCAEDLIEAAQANGQEWRQVVNGAVTKIIGG
ncbi:MAG: hypothetical protein PHH60_01990, partial [Candidatus Margulisbacteria bacterium]|nr:hypothetical protein [Candidatus Margulisiibacteriota bacterium]